MHVSKVELIEKENLITQNNKVPCTFFSLDASEMLDFNNFRRHHDELSGIVREMSGEERQKEEGKAESEFLGLVTPFLEQCGIKPV
ncbi:MAG: hypothetical protein Q8R37_04585, partial [Nanoarchaeota archaeon]|nr:hypothetical protein [Nanoarchaeota archaeon]